MTLPAKPRIFYGWYVVAACFLANVAYAEQFNASYGVFMYHLSQETGWGRALLSGVKSIGWFAESAVAPFVLTLAISAAGLIRKVKLEAGLADAFLRFKTARTFKDRSVSTVGKVAVMSYFCTSQVFEARLSVCANAEKAQVKSNKAKIIAD